MSCHGTIPWATNTMEKYKWSPNTMDPKETWWDINHLNHSWVKVNPNMIKLKNMQMRKTNYLVYHNPNIQKYYYWRSHFENYSEPQRANNSTFMLFPLWTPILSITLWYFLIVRTILTSHILSFASPLKKLENNLAPTDGIVCDTRLCFGLIF